MDERPSPAGTLASAADPMHTRILDAAGELFFELGYRGTSVDALAERLAVAKPFIYTHFKGKADILAGVCGRTTAFAAGAAEEHARKSGPATPRLAAMVRELTLRVIEGRIFLAVYFTGRFLVEFVKEYQSQAPSGLTIGQYLSIPFILLGIYGIWYSLKHGRPAQAAA